MSKIRINKFLADAGVASRRKVEEYITAGRVMKNDKVAQLGDQVNMLQDEIFVDGRLIKFTKPESRLLAFYKPEGVVCSKERGEFKKTIFDYLENDDRWINIGRLDVNSRGLLLFTNDGEIAHKAMHPSSELERRYLVKVFGEMNDDIFDAILEGVEIEGERYKFKELRLISSIGIEHYFGIMLTEGKNREVRRVFEYFGFVVNKLKRISFGNITLRALRAGQTREITGAELNNFLRLVKHDSNKSSQQAKPTKRRSDKSSWQ